MLCAAPAGQYRYHDVTLCHAAGYQRLVDWSINCTIRRTIRGGHGFDDRQEHLDQGSPARPGAEPASRHALHRGFQSRALHPPHDPWPRRMHPARQRPDRGALTHPARHRRHLGGRQRRCRPGRRRCPRPRGCSARRSFSYTLRRVWLDKQLESEYYYGLANEGLWPLCHVAFHQPVFRLKDWESYRLANQIFADAVLEEAGGDPAFHHDSLQLTQHEAA